MIRRRFILVTTLAAAAAGVGMQARPAHAADGGYQLWQSPTGDLACGGTCKTGACCKIVPL